MLTLPVLLITRKAVETMASDTEIARAHAEKQRARAHALEAERDYWKAKMPKHGADGKFAAKAKLGRCETDRLWRAQHGLPDL